MRKSSDNIYIANKVSTSSYAVKSKQQGEKKLDSNFQQLALTSRTTNDCTNNNHLPLVSIITVVFNGEKFIEQTIKSVIAQTYNNIEYIIIDGGSTDKTLEIIRQYENDIDYWISEPDKGIYDAMNKGIKLSRGKLIGLINSDDWYLKNAVEIAVEAYVNSPQSNLIITGDIYRTDSQGNILFRLNKPASFLHQKINKIMPINHPATFVVREVYAEIGVFNEQYKIAGDYDFIYRAYYSKKVDFLFTEACLAYMRLDGLSEKVSSLWARNRENYLLRSKYIHFVENLYISTYTLFLSIAKALIKPILGKSLLSTYHKCRHRQF